MSKHTPGPWVFDVESGGYPSWVQGLGGAEVLSGCGCCGSPNLGIDDARLICAAPDLLEALDIIVKLDENKVYMDEPWQEALALARAAIAKALGEE